MQKLQANNNQEKERQITNLCWRKTKLIFKVSHCLTRRLLKEYYTLLCPNSKKGITLFRMALLMLGASGKPAKKVELAQFVEQLKH